MNNVKKIILLIGPILERVVPSGSNGRTYRYCLWNGLKEKTIAIQITIYKFFYIPSHLKKILLPIGQILEWVLVVEHT